jgi:hypothetical protein
MAQFKKRMMTGFADGREWRQFMSDLYDDLNALKTLVNEIRTDYEAHRQSTAAHTAADTTNAVSTAAVTLKTTAVE